MNSTKIVKNTLANYGIFSINDSIYENVLNVVTPCQIKYLNDILRNNEIEPVAILSNIESTPNRKFFERFSTYDSIVFIKLTHLVLVVNL